MSCDDTRPVLVSKSRSVWGGGSPHLCPASWDGAGTQDKKPSSQFSGLLVFTYTRIFALFPTKTHLFAKYDLCVPNNPQFNRHPKVTTPAHAPDVGAGDTLMRIPLTLCNLAHSPAF